MASQVDQNFYDMLIQVCEEGDLVTNRTGMQTRSVLGIQKRYNLSGGFPIVQAKKTYWKKAIAEMLWFLSGECDNLKGLEELGAGNIWRPWVKDEHGSLGPIYGVQWRRWVDEKHGRIIDQMGKVIEQIKARSDSRRLIISAWNPVDIEEMALPPCHTFMQFTVRNEKLHMQMYQRSCDLPIGGPFNVLQYSALVHMIAKLANLEVGEFIHTIHDAHIYVNQMDAVKQWLDNFELGEFSCPQLHIKDRGQKEIDDFLLDDFEVVNYSHMGKLDIPVTE